MNPGTHVHMSEKVDMYDDTSLLYMGVIERN